MHQTEEKVILVDTSDRPIGSVGKMEAHQKGLLHRAFSVFIFNNRGEIILQQRAFNKYHSPGLWTNTCCSHPRPDETLEEAAHRRLKEEMGFDTDIRKAFDFIYRYEFQNGLIEYEFDHVFVGEYSGVIHPNADEVIKWEAVPLKEVKEDVLLNKEKYTYWFSMVVEQFWDKLGNV